MSINRRLARVENYLRDASAARDQRPVAARIRSTLTHIKRDAVASWNEPAANTAWCYETIFAIQYDYCRAFEALKRQEFYEAWCIFERVELGLLFLAPHLTGDAAIYKLDFIERQVANFQ